MTLTLAQITEKAAQHVCERNRIEKIFARESWTETLENELRYQDRMSAHTALEEIVSAAIQIERMNR